MKRRIQHHTVEAFVRDTLLLVREFRVSLLLFAGLMLIGALWLQFGYKGKEGKELGFSEALYATLMLVFLNPTLDFPKQWWVQPVFFIVPIVGISVLMEGIIRFGVLLFAKHLREEEWQKVMASTYKNHTVVCGVGRLGYRIIKELLKLGEEVIAIEESAVSPFVSEIRQLGVPVIVGQAKQGEILRSANVDQARCIVIANEDDLANLEITLKAKEFNPRLRIVLRLFNEELAERVGKALGVHAVLSSSAVSAPAFASAAASHATTHSFYVGDQLFHIAELVVKPGSKLANMSVRQLENEVDVSVVLHRSPDGQVDTHPRARVNIRSNDTIVVLASLESISKIEAMNQ